MTDKDFVDNYLNDFSSLLKPNEEIVDKIIKTRDILFNAKKNDKKIMEKLLFVEMVAARQ